MNILMVDNVTCTEKMKRWIPTCLVKILSQYHVALKLYDGLMVACNINLPKKPFTTIGNGSH